MTRSLQNPVYRPLEAAAKLANTLNEGEKEDIIEQRWTFLLVADTAHPDYATVEIIDETGKRIGWA